MAIKDVRQYYAKCIIQKLELENDFKDFEEALKAGYITEDKMEDVKAEYARMLENITRLSFILYLLELPNRKEKQPKFKKAYKETEELFEQLNASEKCILEENKSIQKYIKETLKELVKNEKDN